MAARGIRRTDRVQNPQTVVVPERLQGREARVQAKVPVQVDHVLRWDRDARALLVVQPLAMRHDHVQPIDGAGLEEANQTWTVGRWDGARRMLHAPRTTDQGPGSPARAHLL